MALLRAANMNPFNNRVALSSTLVASVILQYVMKRRPHVVRLADQSHAPVSVNCSWRFIAACCLCWAPIGEKCDDSTPCRFRFDTCTDGVCEISAAGLIDVSAFTVVRTSATSFDPRLEVEGGCGVTMGCTASRTRDGKSKPASRWSCSEKLRKGKCALTYSFDAPQDVRGLRMAFHEGDHSRHTLRVSTINSHCGT